MKMCIAISLWLCQQFANLKPWPSRNSGFTHEKCMVNLSIVMGQFTRGYFHVFPIDHNRIIIYIIGPNKIHRLNIVFWNVLMWYRPHSFKEAKYL
jgi:hypothetical protein